jgi:hypothetical protein
MRHAQVMVYESDGRLAELLRPHAAAGRWNLRELRHLEACLGLLQRGGGSVLVLKVGRDLEQELDLLERAGRLFPDVPAVVVGDSDHPALAGLVWDLGARFVLFPPLPRDLLPDVVAGLLAAPEPSR